MHWAWAGAILVGLSLGLLGAGGSILTVPVLVYLVGVPEKLAIAESLAIVGLISAAGSVPFIYRSQVDWRNVLFFGVPGMGGTYLGAFLSKYFPGSVQLVLFAAVMLFAAGMLYNDPRKGLEEGEAPEHAAWKIVGEGLGVGVLTGLVGVGGGFLIVPALVLLGGLPLFLAIGTSLAIIALKSFSGFYKYVDVLAQAGLEMDWSLIGLFGVLGILGSVAGSRIGRYVPRQVLKKAFSVLLVAMAGYVLYQNLPQLL